MHGVRSRVTRAAAAFACAAAALVPLRTEAAAESASGHSGHLNGAGEVADSWC